MLSNASSIMASSFTNIRGMANSTTIFIHDIALNTDRNTILKRKHFGNGMSVIYKATVPASPFNICNIWCLMLQYARTHNKITKKRR